MQKFIFIYRGGGMPSSPEEGAKMMEDWNAWYAGMGDALVDPGAGLGKSNTVSADGVTGDGGVDPTNGFTVVSATDHAAANEMAKGCPMVPLGGRVEVAPVMEM